MLTINTGSETDFRIEKKAGRYLLDGTAAEHQVVKVDDSHYKVFTKTKAYDVHVEQRDGNEVGMSINGKSVVATCKSHIDQLLDQLGMNASANAKVMEMTAPMPGTILSLSAKVGDEIAKGEPLLILEAMKMENVIKSPGDGTVGNILVKEGENVEKNQLLISFQ